MASLLGNSQSIVPTPGDVQLARESSRQLTLCLGPDPRTPVTVHIQSSDSSELISIPSSAFRLLQDILAQMARGNAVAAVSLDTDLTVEQAADLLNVSLPFVLKELEAGAIACRMMGTEQRILLKDLLDYKHASDQKSLQCLDELARQAQELDMGY